MKKEFSNGVQETQLQSVLDEFYSVCGRRNLKMNVGNSKVMVSERKEVEMCKFSTPNRVVVPAERRCKIVLGDERMEEVKEFKYLGTR